MIKPLEVQAIITAWNLGNIEEAIALTQQFAKSQRRCHACGISLSPQAKGDYCHHHRGQDQKRKAAVKKAKAKAKAKS